MLRSLLCLVCLLFYWLCTCQGTFAQGAPVAFKNRGLDWSGQSKNAGESMPCGGGDIGLNVWVENGELLFYIARTGTFDENNTLLKLGRVRIKLEPDFLSGDNFHQLLNLNSGQIELYAEKGREFVVVQVWADVFQPVVHVKVQASDSLHAEVNYESWRYNERKNTGRANNANSWKWAPQGEVITRKDSVRFEGANILFFHRNQEQSVFDATAAQQGLQSVKDQLYNPLHNLTFGGQLSAPGFQPVGISYGRYEHTEFSAWKLRSKAASLTHAVSIHLHTAQSNTLAQWQQGLQQFIKQGVVSTAAEKMNGQWWTDFWNRSFIRINPSTPNESDTAWQAGRNYQLFRYMLACNATGIWPTKFNGGLFTYDPSLIDSTQKFTPDFRAWGGGTHTAQNQRLVHWPMLKSGDWELLKPQFDFYLRLLKNAELRSRVYWNHAGACFTEQMENFGLPNPAEYGWKRPADFDKGVEYNAWLEYEWDTVLEFCLMMLETERYAGANIKSYLPLIESCLRFFDEHYQYLAKQRGRKALDGNGHLVIYPGSAAETYKMAYNPSSTIAALTTVTERMLALPPAYLTVAQRSYLDSFRARIPPLPFTQVDGKKTISPAITWERINNVETPQLYPVFPWGIYGVGKKDLDVARNTYLLDTSALKFRSHVGWKQDNIWAARLGLTEDAARLTFAKLKNSGRRFPAFWGPGFDWTPDLNWGGSGAISLQEMLLQTDDRKIYLFPTWPKHLDVHFKLHAPYQTTVEAEVKGGKIQSIIVLPKEREADIINLFN